MLRIKDLSMFAVSRQAPKSRILSPEKFSWCRNSVRTPRAACYWVELRKFVNELDTIAGQECIFRAPQKDADERNATAPGVLEFDSMELRIKRGPRVEAEIAVPGDKSISHRAAIIAALSNGVCTLHGFLPSEDCMHTVNALRSLGIQIEQPEPDVLVVHGKKRVLTPPEGEIDCGNSGTTMRLMAGLLAGQTFESRLVGDASLSRRPMDRVIEPLRKMGADIVAEGPEQTPPLRIRGGSLRGIHYRSPIASAQVKSAILLAGLFAKGKTTVDEPSASRNHTELMFNYFLIRTAKAEDSISVFGDQIPESRDFSIPGDISSAAFWLVAAAAQSGGHLLVRNIGLNDTRTALLGVLVRMGAQVREAVEDTDQLEPRGVAEVTGVPLKGTVIHGKEIPQMIDELPELEVAGELANGTTIR